jgi:hypothetical protein
MNYIFIVNINTPYYSKYCINSWEMWGKKYNIEVITLNENFNKSIEPHWNKTFALDILEHSNIKYDKVAVVDNDTIVNPRCPNFFEEVSSNEIGVSLDDTNYDWIIRSMEAYGKFLFKDFKSFSPFEYFNSGFMVLDKNHKDLFHSIVEFLKLYYNDLNRIQNTFGVGRDQTPLNFLIRYLIDIVYSEFKFKFMDIKYNVQGLLSKEVLDLDILDKYSYITHFNAMDSHNRTILMEQMYNKYYE